MQWPGEGRDDDGSVEPGDEQIYEAGEQLTLADDDEALPWLESEDDYEADDGFDTRMVVLAVLGLLAVGAILAAAWYFFGRGSEPIMAPDGSTIEAPDEPYKTRPADPGGAEVEGTGDLSYEVGEGEGREGRIPDQAPAPSIDRDQTGSRNEESEGAEAAEQPAAAGVAVQVGAYSNRATAESGWSQLSGRFEALQGLRYRIVEARADSGTIYRLQAIAGNLDAADAVCRSIRNSGGDCQVKR